MTASADFRIEVLINSLHEFQREKERLAFRYNEIKARRKGLENKFDNVTEKCYQSKEKFVKMQETVNIAKRRVSQTQAQADRLKELNEEKRSSITKLNKQIQEQEKKDDNETKRFEDTLFELTERFRNARSYYKEPNILKETEKCNADSANAVVQAKELQGTSEELNQRMQNLELENKKEKDKSAKTLEYGVTPEELQTAQEVFCAMNKEAADFFVQCENELEEEQKILTDLKTEERELTASRESLASGQKQQELYGGSSANTESEKSDRPTTTSVPVEQVFSLQTSSNSRTTVVDDSVTESQDLGSVPLFTGQHTVSGNDQSKIKDARRSPTRNRSFQSRPYFISSPFIKRK